MTSVSAVSGARDSSSPSTIGQLGSDEFLNIVLQELQSQDPLEPNDTSQMLEQLSTIMSIQSDSDMIDRLGELVGQNELASASSLIGRLVSGLDSDNNRVAGIVESVTSGTGGVSLHLDDGTQVPMARLDAILEAEERASESSEESGESDDEGDDKPAEEPTS